MRSQSKRYLAALCVVIFAALGVSSAQAQTVIAVPFDTATLSWTVPAPDATHSAPSDHTVSCGANTATVPMPQTSILVSAVVPGPGTYTCTVYAQNVFGRHAGPDVSFPVFEAGFPPLAPTNAVIIVP